MHLLILGLLPCSCVVMFLSGHMREPHGRRCHLSGFEPDCTERMLQQRQTSLRYRATDYSTATWPDASLHHFTSEMSPFVLYCFAVFHTHATLTDASTELVLTHPC